MRPLTHQPAMRRIPLLLMLALAPSLLDAQSAISRETPLVAAPGGRALATLRSGAVVRASTTTRGGATQVTIDGWVHRTMLGGRRDAFARSVTRDGANLRVAPSASARVVATLERGMGLNEVSRRGEWVRVRRSAWVPSRALRSATATATPARPGETRPTALAQRRPTPQRARTSRPRVDEPPPPATETTARSTEQAASDALTPRGAVAILSAPGERAIGAAEPGVRLHVVARDRGWVRVRMEGWVPDSALVPADTTVARLSAADIRANPDAARGRTVSWEVQKISYQLADALRKDLAQNEPYLLARGPGNENALLYLALPPSLAERAQAVPELSTIRITARVRTGRSEPAGVPILDVISLAQK